MKDFDLSKTLTNDFLSSTAYTNIPNKIDLSITIFSMNSWPLKNLQYTNFTNPVSNVHDSAKFLSSQKWSMHLNNFISKNTMEFYFPGNMKQALVKSLVILMDKK